MTQKPQARDEYITIIGDTFEDVVRESRAQKLSEQNYSIVSPIEQHQFTMASHVGGVHGQKLVTATFIRRAR